MNNYFGMPVFTTDLMPKKKVQTKFPRSKKRRIKEKWAKKYYKYVDQAFLSGGSCFVSSIMAKEMEKYLNDVGTAAMACSGTASFGEKSDVITIETLRNAVELMKQNDVRQQPVKFFDYYNMEWFNG